MRIKKGDTVKIISGKDRGKTGKILRIDASVKTVLVEGLNVFKKHRRPKKEGEKGEIVSMAKPLSAAKVMLVCGRCSQPTRAGYRLENKTKIRYCKKCKNAT